MLHPHDFVASPSTVQPKERFGRRDTALSGFACDHRSLAVDLAFRPEQRARQLRRSEGSARQRRTDACDISAPMDQVASAQKVTH